jgi:hypothetical protein
VGQQDVAVSRVGRVATAGEGEESRPERGGAADSWSLAAHAAQLRHGPTSTRLYFSRSRVLLPAANTHAKHGQHAYVQQAPTQPCACHPGFTSMRTGPIGWR